MISLPCRALLASVLVIVPVALAESADRAVAQGAGSFDGYEDYDEPPRTNRNGGLERAPPRYPERRETWDQGWEDRPSDDRGSDDRRYGDDTAASDDYGSDAPYDPVADDEDDYEDGREVPDVTYFYAELEPYGRWAHHREYGEVWIPHDQDRGWRPYTRGHWVNTEEHGWYWASDEPFGWATYHYGRWFLDEDRGWVWVPGTRWGPAWVAWRSSDDYVGWAPLPPDAYWEPRHGLRYSTAIYDEPRFTMYWSFVEPAYISAPRVYERCAPFDRTPTIIHRTRPETSYVIVNRRIVNRGVPVTRIEHISRTRVVTQRIAVSNDYARRGADHSDGMTVRTYRPKLTHYRAAHDRMDARPPVVLRDVDRRVVRRPPPKTAKPVMGPPRASGPGKPPAARAMLGPYRATPSGPPKRVTLPPAQHARIKPGMDAFERAQVRAQQDRAVRARTTQEAIGRKALPAKPKAVTTGGSAYGNLPH